MTNMDLLQAISEKKLDIVKRILVDYPNLVSREALFDAARIGSLDIVRYLVEYSRISLNEYDDHHRNVLQVSYREGRNGSS